MVACSHPAGHSFKFYFNEPEGHCRYCGLLVNDGESEMSIMGLAEKINEGTGAEGPELEALTSFVAACYADFCGRKDIGDYFNGRCQEAKAKMENPQ